MFQYFAIPKCCMFWFNWIKQSPDEKNDTTIIKIVVWVYHINIKYYYMAIHTLFWESPFISVHKTKNGEDGRV